MASKEQLRHAVGVELWRIEDTDLQAFLGDRPTDYHDIREEADGATDEPPDVIPEFQVVAAEEAREEDEADGQEQEMAEDQVGEAAAEGPLPLPLPQPPPDALPLPPPDLLPLPPPEADDQPLAILDSIKRDSEQVAPDEVVHFGAAAEPAAKKLRHANITYVDATTDEMFAKPLLDAVRECYLAAQSDDEGAEAKPKLNRKEQKALEKEIPWHLIPEQDREDYRQALVKEWGTWKKYGAVEALSLECSRQVEAFFQKPRILATRVCYRNKNAAFPWMPLKAKARLVGRGDCDPDLIELRRDAPTMTRLGLMTILQIAASFD